MLCVLSLAGITGPLSHAGDVASTKVQTKSWTKFFPYTPEKKEYQFELGGMWEEDNLYWLGATLGYRLGHCAYSTSQKCHQYFDLTGGVGSREAFTEGLALLSLRWQYVQPQQSFSPMARVFGGILNLRDDHRDRAIGTFGAGVGVAATLHEKLDVKWEVRAGQGDDEPWVQTFISFGFKLGGAVESGAKSVIGDSAAKGAGNVINKTLETTGQVLKSTIEAPKTFMDWFNKSQKEKSGEEIEKPSEDAGKKNNKK